MTLPAEILPIPLRSLPHKLLCKFAATIEPDGVTFRHVCPGGEIRFSATEVYGRYCTCELAGPVEDRTEPCSYIGNQMRLQECDTCSGKVQIKLFGCAKYGECSIGKALSGIACCANCNEYEPQERKV